MFRAYRLKKALSIIKLSQCYYKDFYDCNSKMKGKFFSTLMSNEQANKLNTPDLNQQNIQLPQREKMEYDVLIVGGGVAGLSTAIKLKQLQREQGKDISVCLIEKGSEIGAHQLSGCCFETRSFDELYPKWRQMKEKRPPLNTPVSEDVFAHFISQQKAFYLPKILMPKDISNDKGNYVISLGQLTKWLAEQATEMGVEIYTGFAGNEILYTPNGAVRGVATKDFGIGKNNQKREQYSRGVELVAKQTVLSEGAAGSLSNMVMNKYDLRKNCSPQTYALGLKELWEIRPENFTSGKVQHSVGWPLDNFTYGGSFMYFENPNLLHIGLVVGLDYANPYLNTYEEFQKFKTHASVNRILEGGNCIQYGARVLNEGGYFAIPKLTFPGGMLTGCSAGFLNTMKIKGTHTAIKSGIEAAKSIFFALKTQGKGIEEQGQEGLEIVNYSDNMKKSWVYKEMHQTRNFHSAFKFSLFGGLAYGGLINFVTKGKEFWNLNHGHKRDFESYKINKSKKINYIQHDGIYTFDLLDNLIKSGTNHEHDQPSHLVIKQDKQQMPSESFKQLGGPEQMFCPAKVYEFIPDQQDNMILQINAQNCLHCKACSVKMPFDYIDWTVPEGGGGPNYSNM